MSPNIHEEYIRSLQTEIAIIDCKLNNEDMSLGSEKKLREKQVSLRNELNCLLGECKELKHND